jgi:cupin superfamily acireductone dioxygenase involved in methionine salvage
MQTTTRSDIPKESAMKHAVAAGLSAILALAGATTAFSDTATPMKVHDVDGAKIYRVPFYRAINVINAELFPHHDALKKQHNWKVAYLDLGYMICHALVEEVPPNTTEIVGQKLLAEINYVVIAGEGIVVHRKPDGTERRLAVKEGDIFFIPYGHWVGLANPAATSLRVMGWMVAMFPSLMDQDRELVDEDGLRPAVPYVSDYVRYQRTEGAATSAGQVTKDMKLDQRGAMPVNKKAAFTVYEPEWGRPINMSTLEAPPHHFPKRAEEGWRDAHLEMGGRAINNFIIQEEAPSFKEIGHKHGGDVFFYGLRGKGYIAMRPEVDSPERRVFWGVGDLFVLPRVKGGVWHAHGNYTDEQNRLIYTPPDMGRTLEDPWQLRYIKDWVADSVDRDEVWKAVKPPQE